MNSPQRRPTFQSPKEVVAALHVAALPCSDQARWLVGTVSQQHGSSLRGPRLSLLRLGKNTLMKGREPPHSSQMSRLHFKKGQT